MKYKFVFILLFVPFLFFSIDHNLGLSIQADYRMLLGADISAGID